MPTPAGVRRPDPLAASITFAATGVVFGAGGYWLDVSFDTLPLFLIIGLLFGFAAGFLHLLSVIAPDLMPFRKQAPPAADDPPNDDDPKS